jgi:hypothetical protein
MEFLNLFRVNFRSNKGIFRVLRPTDKLQVAEINQKV